MTIDEDENLLDYFQTDADEYYEIEDLISSRQQDVLWRKIEREKDQKVTLGYPTVYYDVMSKCISMLRQKNTIFDSKSF